jgi:hypothetical protein
MREPITSRPYATMSGCSVQTAHEPNLQTTHLCGERRSWKPHNLLRLAQDCAHHLGATVAERDLPRRHATRGKGGDPAAARADLSSNPSAGEAESSHTF